MTPPIELRSERVALAKVVEAVVLEELRASKPGRALYTNVEFWSAVVLEHAGIPRPSVHADVRVLTHDRMDGTHPRAGTRQPVDPSDGGLRRSEDRSVPSLVKRRGVVRCRARNPTSGRMHRTCACARRLAQRRLRVMDLVQRIARFLETLRATYFGERPERSHATRNSTAATNRAIPPRRNSNPAKELTAACYPRYRDTLNAARHTGRLCA